MISSKVLLAVGSMMVVGAPIAATASQSVGVMNASNRTMIVRDNTVMAATSNMPIFAGDRVITSVGGKASVRSAGCSTNVGSSSVFVAGSAGCGSVAGFAAAPSANASVGQEEAGAGGGSSGFIVAGLAVLAVAAGVYVVADSGDSAPTSP